MPTNNGKKTDAKKSSMNANEAILKELILIRRLMLFLIAKLGSDSPEISTALQIPERTLRNWISFGGIDRSNRRMDNKEGNEITKASKKAKKRASNKLIPKSNVGTQPVETISTGNEVMEATEDKTTEPTIKELNTE
jgi:hypothetical protein